MKNRCYAAAGSALRLALGAVICAGLAVCSAGRVAAQEIDPYEFVPLPAGTNLAIGYYVYGHNDEFDAYKGPTFKNSKLEVNVAVARFVHFFEIAGHPAGVQVLQGFGSESGGNVGGERLGSAFGAQSTTLSAFIWPYVNTATKTNVVTTAFLYPPDGTYDPHAALNLGDNRWRGDIQIGLSQGFGDHIGVDLEFDAQFYGDSSNSYPGGQYLKQDPTYRVQAWANYRWTPAFTTSIGYEGFFGGVQKLDSALDGNKTDEQRLRFNAALFITPSFQTMLEFNHDVSVSGGFKQDFGAEVRVLKAF